jgi:hypothetical protein
MTLSEQQRLFVRLVGLLIEWAYANGYEITFGEAYRTPEQAALNAAKGIGISNTLHTLRLAIDLNLFINGVYITASPAYQRLGEQWESMHTLARWGGRFSKPDGSHISLEWQGVK